MITIMITIINGKSFLNDTLQKSLAEKYCNKDQWLLLSNGRTLNISWTLTFKVKYTLESKSSGELILTVMKEDPFILQRDLTCQGCLLSYSGRTKRTRCKIVFSKTIWIQNMNSRSDSICCYEIIHRQDNLIASATDYGDYAHLHVYLTPNQITWQTYNFKKCQQPQMLFPWQYGSYFGTNIFGLATVCFEFLSVNWRKPSAKTSKSC